MPVFEEAAAGDGLFWGQKLLHEKLGDKTQSLILFFFRSDFFFFSISWFWLGRKIKKKLCSDACGNLENWQLSATTITTATTKSFCCRQTFIFKGASSENRIFLYFYFLFWSALRATRLFGCRISACLCRPRGLGERYSTEACWSASLKVHSMGAVILPCWYLLN